MQYSQSEVDKLFPIHSQTSTPDKSFLLNSVKFLKKFVENYSYIEVGSYMGGGLAPFLTDPACKSVTSVDERERAQPDERGANFDYAGITHQTMIDNLERHGIDTKKLKTFDGSINEMPIPAELFDLSFIDGEHTDYACFRDFLWLLPMMKSDSLIMFHDSTLIYKAIRLIDLYLRKIGAKYKLIKLSGSEVSGIFLGNFGGVDFPEEFGPEDNLESFFETAETTIINHLVANRVIIKFSATVIPPKTIPVLS